MAAIDELGRLLNELRRVSSPLGRMKLLARGWRSIQRLGPRERQALAKHVGVEGAEHLIERMAAQKGRIGPALIQRALDKVRESDPGQLKNLLHGLRDPVRRTAMLERGIDALAGGLSEPDRATGLETAGAAEPKAQAAPPAEARPAPESAPPSVPETPAAPARPPDRNAIPAAGPEIPRESEPEAEPEEAPAPEPQSQERPDAEPAPEPATIAEPAREPTPAPLPRTAPEGDGALPLAAASPEAPNRLLDKLAQADDLTHKFRALRQDITLASGLSMEQLERLLDAFPPGWARRRALAALFRAGLPESTAQAAALVERLGSPVDRRWCARALSNARELSSAEREALDSLAK